MAYQTFIYFFTELIYLQFKKIKKQNDKRPKIYVFKFVSCPFWSKCDSTIINNYYWIIIIIIAPLEHASYKQLTATRHDVWEIPLVRLLCMVLPVLSNQ